MKKIVAVLLLLILSAIHSLRAQNVSTPVAPTPNTRVALGHSLVALTGPWKFHIGDNPRWANPNFDDSSWSTMDLTSTPEFRDPYYGTQGFLPGWTARGYAGYSGYAWYRLRINVEDNAQGAARNANAALALKMPHTVDDAYQVYVDGQFIGEFGRFTAHGAAMYLSQPRAFSLPASVRSGPVTIAVRMWMDPSTPLTYPDAGGLHGPPVLGRASVIHALLRLDWYVFERASDGEFMEIAILLLALLVAFGLYALDRGEPAYLWLGLTCAVLLLDPVVLLLGDYANWIRGTFLILLDDAVLYPVAIGLWVLFWGYWFRLERMSRLHRMVWGLVIPLAIGTAMQRAPLYGRVVPVHAIVWLSPLAVVLKLLLGLLLVWVTVQGIRRHRAEGWLALPAVLLVAVSRYQEELLVLHVHVFFYPYGVQISINKIATVLSLGIITVLMLRRFLQGQRQREQWKLEMEQARQVQSLLVPTTPPITPGFAVESVYLPAQKVGGDFFQIFPGEDGSLLIVVGDVSGKGLKAAMTVSTIVGALRGCAVRKPDEVLAYLNRVLHGQIKGFVTCCAALIAADGAVTLANAGHLPPYLHGKELPVEGALPLGMMDGVEFSVMHFQLAPGDTLMLMSDGVAEAQDEQGHLFGFERINEILRKPITATQVAATAQKFGQEDDISVLSITRLQAMKAVHA